MTKMLRRAIAALLMLTAFAAIGAAQDEVNVVGSGVAGRAFQAIVTDAPFAYEFSGTQSGIGLFCGGGADIVLTSRPLSVAEDTACAANGVEYSELLFAYDGYALIASEDVDFLDCVSSGLLSALIVPSAAGDETSWRDANPEYPDLAFQFVLPAGVSQPAALLDPLVVGDGFRADALTGADSDEVVSLVSSGSGRLGLVSLNAALSAEGVRVLELDNPTLTGCYAPSVAQAFDRQYSGGTRLFAYVSTGALEAEGVADALSAVIAADAAASLDAAGFVAPTEAIAAQNADVLSNGTSGRVFSGDVVTYQILGDTTGTLRVGGDSAAADYLSLALPAVSRNYSTITVEETILGAAEGIREFCNGNRELLALTRDLTDEERANCEAAEIEVVTQPLGSQTSVLIGNGSSQYLSCLTTAQLAAAVTASAELPASWDQVDPSFAADPIYVFVAGKSAVPVEVALSGLGEANAVVREDVQVNADALYRAAAVANTPGAVAILSWAELADVADSGQEGYQVVSVDAGAGCVEPSVETASDGTYALARPISLAVTKASLERDIIQATLFTLFADTSYQYFVSSGLVGLSFTDLVGVRAALAEQFAEADAAEAERFAAEVAATQTAIATLTPQGEVTPEPTPEATPGS
ncbi:MAG: substrate-binding domain-containing protein [Chloroflexi bacterium]|nr:substrate-binding domain-containing protein [Chloroflexota bacterium]